MNWKPLFSKNFKSQNTRAKSHTIQRKSSALCCQPFSVLVVTRSTKQKAFNCNLISIWSRQHQLQSARSAGTYTGDTRNIASAQASASFHRRVSFPQPTNQRQRLGLGLGLTDDNAGRDRCHGDASVLLNLLSPPPIPSTETTSAILHMMLGLLHGISSKRYIAFCSSSVTVTGDDDDDDDALGDFRHINTTLSWVEHFSFSHVCCVALSLCPSHRLHPDLNPDLCRHVSECLFSFFSWL